MRIDQPGKEHPVAEVDDFRVRPPLTQLSETAHSQDVGAAHRYRLGPRVCPDTGEDRPIAEDLYLRVTHYAIFL